MQNNVNDTFFDGQYKEIWRSLIPEELTIKEVDFMIPYFKLEPGARVLDLMCGYGRHAIALARKGMAVKAVDNLGDYVSEINEIAEKDQLPLKAMQADVTNFSIQGEYDLILCMGNSLNFFNPTDTQQLLNNISRHLARGGHLLINSWSIAEIAFKNFQPRTWTTVNDLKFLTESRIAFHPARIETESQMIGTDGSNEVKMAVDYIYSINEMESMLLQAGLDTQAVYSIPGKKKFTVGEPRAYIVASFKKETPAL